MTGDARIGIVGIGLIGGSLALALRQGGHRGELVGYDFSVPADVLKGHFVDRVSDSAAALASQCDIVVLATPVCASLALLDEIASLCLPRTVLTDVGSTKQAFADTARRVLNRDNGVTLSVVPGHPIAGSEKSGIDSARADLFRGNKVVLTPLPGGDMQATDAVAALWEKTGARVTRMDPAAHDALFAATSHLPHMVAYALINAVFDFGYDHPARQYSAGGLRDFTRIARSDPVMWRDICLSNRENLMEVIAGFEASLGKLRALVASEDGEALTEFFERSKAYCRRMDLENDA